MDEERTELTEEAEDIGFEGWDDEPAEDTEEEGTEEAQTEDAEDADQQTDTEENAEAEDEKQGEPSQEQPAENDNKTDVFVLKHLGESKEYSRDEMTTLAQKGLDYDRIRTDRDSLRANEGKFKEYESFLKELAGDTEGGIDKLMEDVRTRRLRDSEAAEGRTISEQGAREQIQREKAAREKSAAENAAETAEAPKADAKAQRHEDFTAFAKAYPDVKGTDIPQNVWDDYAAGKADLVTLYARHENSVLKQQLSALKTELEAEKQNSKNRERAAGSRRGVGVSAVKDPIFEGWDD